MQEPPMRRMRQVASSSSDTQVHTVHGFSKDFPLHSLITIKTIPHRLHCALWLASLLHTSWKPALAAFTLGLLTSP
jgi:hypothetical protein